jgi:hypothetical protein
MYDPVTARFLQEDTYSGDPSDPLSLNLYTYCHNEPLMYFDPTGHVYTKWDASHLTAPYRLQILTATRDWKDAQEQLEGLKPGSADYAYWLGKKNAAHEMAEAARNQNGSRKLAIVSDDGFTDYWGAASEGNGLVYVKDEAIPFEIQNIMKVANEVDSVQINQHVPSRREQFAEGLKKDMHEQLPIIGDIIYSTIDDGFVAFTGNHLDGYKEVNESKVLDAKINTFIDIGTMFMGPEIKGIKETSKLKSGAKNLGNFFKKSPNSSSELTSFARKPSDIFSDAGMLPAEWERISPKNLYRELKRSEIGRETLRIIQEKGLNIELNYEKVPEWAENVLGYTTGNYINIYMKNTISKAKTAETVIHEITHAGLGIKGTYRAEIISFMRGAKHFKPNLSISDIKSIMKHVLDNYSNMSYSELNEVLKGSKFLESR